ncbi:MAG TPA: permease [Rubrobacteraceae bacterium]|nr:permease [Rubrobacteraceae bacterium]
MAVSLADTARWFLVTTAELVVLFLALSFLVGLLQTWLPAEKVRSMFERRRPVVGYFVGAALGAVTPFCSYSTIPVLSGLLRSGAPFGPTMAFLFASPLLDPVVLGVLIFLVGVEGTVAYAVLTFSASVLIGALFARLGLEKYVKPLPGATSPDGDDSGCEAARPAKGPVWRRAWADAWAFFVPALPYLLVGTAAGAAIYGLVPTSWVVAVAGPGQPFAIPLAAVLGVPMYVNAETFFPISAALLEKGVGVGAVMALVITSMGVSLPEVVLLGGLFRWRLVAALVASVFFVAVGGGALFALALG